MSTENVNGKENGNGKEKPLTLDEQYAKLGIDFVKTPEQQTHAGIFEPPPNFPKDRYAIEWVPDDQVRYKEQRQTMIGVGATVPGLTVWRGLDGRSKVEKRVTSGNKSFTLMVRPKGLQMAMNAIYGNVSKRYYNNALRGNSLGADDHGREIPLQDAGMLPEDRLREEIGDNARLEESLMALNKIDAESPQEAAEVST